MILKTPGLGQPNFSTGLEVIFLGTASWEKMLGFQWWEGEALIWLTNSSCIYSASQVVMHREKTERPAEMTLDVSRAAQRLTGYVRRFCEKLTNALLSGPNYESVCSSSPLHFCRGLARQEGTSLVTDRGAQDPRCSKSHVPSAMMWETTGDI